MGAGEARQDVLGAGLEDPACDIVSTKGSSRAPQNMLKIYQHAQCPHFMHVETEARGDLPKLAQCLRVLNRFQIPWLSVLCLLVGQTSKSGHLRWDMRNFLFSSEPLGHWAGESESVAYNGPCSRIALDLELAASTRTCKELYQLCLGLVLYNPTESTMKLIYTTPPPPPQEAFS